MDWALRTQHEPMTAFGVLFLPVNDWNVGGLPHFTSAQVKTADRPRRATETKIRKSTQFDINGRGRSLYLLQRPRLLES